MIVVRRIASFSGRTIELLGRLANGIGALAVAGMMVIVCSEVVLRGVFNYTLGWSYDVTQFCVGAAALLSMAYALAQKRHIRVEIFTMHLSPRAQSILSVITSALALLLFGALAWQGWGLAWRQRAFSTTSLVPLPLFPSLLMLPLGAILIFLQLAVDLCREIKSTRAAEPTP